MVATEARETAHDLWVALFFRHRACRHCDETPSGARLRFFNWFVCRLRAALIALTRGEKAESWRQ